MSENAPYNAPAPDEKRTGEQKLRDSRIVEEVLRQTGQIIDKPVNPKTQVLDETQKRLELANKAALEAVAKYYETHQIEIDLREIFKLVRDVYLFEFMKWSKDDVILMLTLQQSRLLLKKIGF